MDNYYLKAFCKTILSLDKLIRFAGIANQLGSILATEYREGLVPLMTKEETSQYAIQAVTRAAMREEFESKIGRLEYSLGKYQKLIRSTIPLASTARESKFYMLLSFDVNSEAKHIIEKKVLPLILLNKDHFA